jgi:trehalose/maltose hydrolase-like predicted phosphorylase
MISFKFAHVTDEFHKSQVQNNSFTRIMLQMNLEGSWMMNNMKFQIASTWFINKLALAKSFSLGMLPKF